jgi:hypothetical protein
LRERCYRSNFLYTFRLHFLLGPAGDPALSLAPPGESEGEREVGGSKSNARDVLLSLALCKRALLLSEQAVCPIASLGHSLGGSQPVCQVKIYSPGYIEQCAAGPVS